MEHCIHPVPPTEAQLKAIQDCYNAGGRVDNISMGEFWSPHYCCYCNTNRRGKSRDELLVDTGHGPFAQGKANWLQQPDWSDECPERKLNGYY